MSKRLDVIYENGIFRPLEPVDVPEHQRMTMMLPEASLVPSEAELCDTEYERWAAHRSKKEPGELPVWPGTVIGSLTREEICDDIAG
jgi:predicted DNA-binding antitoxin AbrB/MazE fold protein